MLKYTNLLVKHIYAGSSLAKSFRPFLTAKFPELAHFPKEINSYESLHRFSIEQNEQFWSTVAKSRLEWMKPFTQVKSGNFGQPDFDLKWFQDGKLNVAGKT